MTTNNKDMPPQSAADVDTAITELKDQIEADKKAREEKDKEHAKKEADKLVGKKALLQSFIDSGASKEAVDAMRKSMGLEEDETPKTPEPETPEATNTEPEKVDPMPVIIDPEPTEPKLEDKRTLEEKNLENSRFEYLKEYFRCKDIAKQKASIFDVFDGKKKRERKEAESITPEYLKAKEAYDKARVEMGDKMFNDKEVELIASGVYGPELDAKLKEYKATEILNKIIIEEGNALASLKAEGTPVNVSKFKKALDWYVKLPRWKKVALSTGIFVGAGAIGAGTLGAGTLGVAGIRFARGMASGFISSSMTKLVDVWNKKKNEEFLSKNNLNKDELKDKFASGTITLEEYEKGVAELDAKNSKRLRNQSLVKLGVGVVFGAGLGYASSHLGIGVDGSGTKGLHGGMKASSDDWFHKQPGVPQDTIPRVDSTAGIDTADHSTQNIDTTTRPDPIDTARVDKPEDVTDSEPTNTEQPEVTPTPETPDTETPEANKVVAEVGKGHGAIKTLEEFQEKLRALYPEGSEDVPESVKHILSTKADRLAIEYGMFKPGDDAESAIMKLGSKFESDAEGNISFTQEGKTTLLEKGDDPDVTNVYKGKMIDGDRSGQARIASEPKGTGTGTSKFLEQNPQKAPDGVIDQTAPKVNDGTSEFLERNPQKAPAGVTEGQKTPDAIKPVTEPTQGINKEAVEEIKSNLTADRTTDISPTKNVFDNSYGTNTETISPTRGVYNTGEGNSTSPNFANSRETVGNGFTTENPMTNEALAERELAEQRINRVETPTRTSDVIENQGPEKLSITQDPRHVETVKEIRETFGRSNVVIDRPEVDKIQGIEHDDWNKAADKMFRVKGVKFDSYEAYEREDEMQRLLGNAKEEVKYVASIDKNDNVVTMNYFRDDPSWNTVKKIPAKYFFDFKDAKFADGTPIPQAELDGMVKSGILTERVNVVPGQATTTSYTFTNRDELERLSNVYEKVAGEKDIELGNTKPIGDENLEKYVGRMTKRVYTADDGTMFATKENYVPSKASIPKTTSDGYETMRSERSYRTNAYNTNNATINTISPRSGASGYQTTSDYNLANRAVDSIIRRMFR